MTNYHVYGAAWFSGKIDADSEEEARFAITAALLNDVGISMKIEVMEVEECT